MSLDSLRYDLLEQLAPRSIRMVEIVCKHLRATSENCVVHAFVLNNYYVIIGNQKFVVDITEKDENVCGSGVLFVC